jgi:hypothetical protein
VPASQHKFSLKKPESEQTDIELDSHSVSRTSNALRYCSRSSHASSLFIHHSRPAATADTTIGHYVLIHVKPVARSMGGRSKLPHAAYTDPRYTTSHKPNNFITPHDGNQVRQQNLRLAHAPTRRHDPPLRLAGSIRTGSHVTVTTRSGEQHR